MMRTRYTVLCVTDPDDWSKEDVKAALVPALAARDFIPGTAPSDWRTLHLGEGETVPYPTSCGRATVGVIVPHGHIVVWVDGRQMDVAVERVPGDVAS